MEEEKGLQPSIKTRLNEAASQVSLKSKKAASFMVFLAQQFQNQNPSPQHLADITFGILVGFSNGIWRSEFSNKHPKIYLAIWKHLKSCNEILYRDSTESTKFLLVMQAKEELLKESLREHGYEPH
jgi:hypothetical protein